MIRKLKINTCAVLCLNESHNRVTVSKLRSFIQANFFDEVVLLINGSIDYLETISGFFVEDFRIKIIDLNNYLNTSYAISSNIKYISSDIIVFVQDINDINKKYLSEIIAPLLLNKKEYTFKKSKTTNYSDSGNIIRDLIGNKAVWKKDIISFLKEISKKDDDLKTAMKRYYKIFRANQKQSESNIVFQLCKTNCNKFILGNDSSIDNSYAILNLKEQGNVKISLN